MSLQHEFIEFALNTNVLRFGEFKTKAGRLSEFYAKTLLSAREEGKIQFDMIFGPAYKGIPLAAAVAVKLAEMGCDIPYAFNRKEAKDHGEGGTIIGAPLKGNVLVIDDVISAGTSVRESVKLIQQAGAHASGVLIALDRMEKGGNAEQMTEVSAVQDVINTFNMPVISIINLHDLLAFMEEDTPMAQQARAYKKAVQAYRERYGV